MHRSLPVMYLGPVELEQEKGDILACPDVSSHINTRTMLDNSKFYNNSNNSNNNLINDNIIMDINNFLRSEREQFLESNDNKNSQVMFHSLSYATHNINGIKTNVAKL